MLTKDTYISIIMTLRILLKCLLDNAAGAIIGKSGKTISDMHAQSKARIKVSQTADFYPGTSDRTILLTGPVHTVLDAQELIWNKISQFVKPRSSGRPVPPPTDDCDTGTPATVTGKILIPNDAGGKAYIVILYTRHAK